MGRRCRRRKVLHVVLLVGEERKREDEHGCSGVVGLERKACTLDRSWALRCRRCDDADDADKCSRWHHARWSPELSLCPVIC